MPWLSFALGETWSLNWSALAWASVLAQTVVGAFASYLVWMWMLGRYPATRVTAFVFFTPLFALLFGALWLGEPVTPGLLLALAMVALGIVLVGPWLGHASWHAYRGCVEWEECPEEAVTLGS